MKMHSVFFPFLFVCLVSLNIDLSGQTSAIDKQITTALSSGNANEISNYFNSRIDLAIPGSDDNYGKPQATKILQDFFVKFPVKSYKFTKQGNSNDGSLFSIGRLEAGNTAFRVYYLMKKTGDKYLIHQFQIQEEN
jgi:hypothetical protein